MGSINGWLFEYENRTVERTMWILDGCGSKCSHLSGQIQGLSGIHRQSFFVVLNLI